MHAHGSAAQLVAEKEEKKGKKHTLHSESVFRWDENTSAQSSTAVDEFCHRNNTTEEEDENKSAKKNLPQSSLLQGEAVPKLLP